MIIADTDVLIDYLAGTQPVAAKLAAYAEAEQAQTTTITCFELLSGAGADKRGTAVRRLLDGLPVLPLDRQSAERAAEVRRELHRRGEDIGMADSLIAGIALSNQAALFTRNRKHFARVDGLRLVDMGDGP